MFSATISQASLRYLFVFPYIVLLLFGIIVPSDGSHGVLNGKSLAFIATTCSLISYLFLYRSFRVEQLKMLLFLLFFLAFLFLWLWISLTNHVRIASLYDQFKLILLTLGVVIMTLFIAKEQLLSYQTFVKTIIYANFTYSICKIAVIILFLSGILDLTVVLETIGIRYMSMAIYGDLTRLQTSADIVSPFLLYFLLLSNKLQIPFSKSFKSLYIVIALLSIFFSFSRFLLGVAILAFLFHWWSLDFYQKIQKAILLFIMGMGALGWIGQDKMSAIIETRFFSRNAQKSDWTRVKQIQALGEEFQNYPLLGKGIGSYSEKVIRDELNYHSYEVQWMAFLMQFGIVGLAILIFPLVIIGYPFLTFPFSSVKISCLLMFITWLISGFFNPFLISLASGILYSLFAWTGMQLKIRHV